MNTIKLSINFLLWGICTISLVVSPSFANLSKSKAEISSQLPVNGLNKALGNSLKTQSLEGNPFRFKGKTFSLSFSKTQVEFPKVLNAHHPIKLQTPYGMVRQFLVSNDSYIAELQGNFLIYRGNKNSIVYFLDDANNSLREFVFLESASDFSSNQPVIQWRFEGANLKVQGNGSIVLSKVILQKKGKTYKQNLDARINRFLEKQSRKNKNLSYAKKLFEIPKPEFIDGNLKVHYDGLRYSTQGQKLALHLEPKEKLVFPLWVDPSLRADPDANITINGQNSLDHLGFNVASAGDFNGDGLEDVIVGARFDDNNFATNSGSAYIFFGRNSNAPSNLSVDSSADVILNGQSDGDRFGNTVASAGDFNGDGLDDVIVGALFDDNNSEFDSGSAYIFFGRNPGAPLTLRADADANIILDGQSAGDLFGNSVGSAGDFNGDGLDDVIVGANSDDNNGENNSGSAFIFFGQNPANQLTLRADLNANVILNGQSANDQFSVSVATAGDFNGDGLDDVVVGATGDDNNSQTNSGSAYVFFGRSAVTQLNLRADADANIILDGQSTGDLFGGSVASAGDFNNDGRDDIIIGARSDDNNGLDRSGSAFIFFGQNPVTQLILRADANADVIMNGAGFRDQFGFSVSSSGDFNADGFGDVIVGSFLDDNNSEDNSGSAFLFFGRNPSGQLTLQADSDADYIFNGQNSNDQFGISVSGVGDFNGDGVDDVIIGAYQDDNNGEVDSGSAFLFYSPESPPSDTVPPVITVLGNNPVNIDLGNPYVDAGATALDDVDGDISTNILVTGLPVDSSVVGQHIVQYEVSDAAGNSTQAQRIVNVLDSDTIPPELFLLGESPVKVEAGTSYVDAGATATDNIDGDLTASIKISGLPIDTLKVGSHFVKYEVMDAAGNLALLERKVIVNDTTPPSITAPLNITMDQTAEFTTVNLGDPDVKDTIGLGPVFNNAPNKGFPVGKTEVVWTAQDLSGNEATANQQVTINPVPGIQLQILIEIVRNLEINSGFKSSLLAKLNSAEKSLLRSNQSNEKTEKIVLKYKRHIRFLMHRIRFFMQSQEKGLERIYLHNLREYVKRIYTRYIRLSHFHKNSDRTAKKILGAFINQVEGQTGKKIDEAQSNNMIDKAKFIISLI